MLDAADYPSSARIAQAVVRVWPEHERFLAQSFGSRDASMMAATERRADAILRVVGDEAALAAAADDYRFISEKLLEEELYFRRNDRYRLARFDDALAEVYSNGAFMARYMNLIILSHVLWDNHARAMTHFEERYLPSLPAGAQHLEVGPGHGLLLHFAANAPAVAGVTGWDVSQTSIDVAARTLSILGDRAQLTVQDLFEAPAQGPRFDSVALSEILEHLEDPVAALKAVSRHMRPGALLWINVPVNSPAPDHIFLYRTPEAVVEAVEAAGFTPVDSAFFPMTGQTLERARKRSLTITAVVTAQLPA